MKHGGQGDDVPLSEHPWVKRRMAYLADKEAAQQELDDKLLRETHAHNLKMNANLRREYGDKAGEFTCPPQCPICHPPAILPEVKRSLDIRDLRAGVSKHATPGKRGTCKQCGKKCSNRRWVYCSTECKVAARKERNLRSCEWCSGSLPEGSRKDKKYCSAKCSVAAYRKRKRDTART
ncbi:MAG: hypothetical protein A2Y74_08380 [Actinobacteria bacterium RBG_13_63_9]|nr:MAG: hypothetical protein A2Y74_08380 [Actinobacteria bacterium RBG_13_63_9]